MGGTRDGGGDVPLISICIVTGRRIPLLRRCLESIRAQVGAPPYEVLVCSDGDHDVADAVRESFPDAVVGFVESALPGAARNLLVERARGDILFFVDDDATLAVDALDRLARLAAEHPDVGVFGGPNDTPQDSSRFQFVQGAVLASLVGSGPVRRRYGAHPAGLADERFFILCNLAVRAGAMVPFSDGLVCAEENALLAEMRREGVTMYYDPDLLAFHERRPTASGFARQMYKYGRGRGQLTAAEPRTLRPAYAAPSALLTYVLVLPLLLSVLGPLAAVPAAAYGVAVVGCATWIAGTLRRPAALPVAAVLTVVLHACYGAGVWRGLFEAGGEPAPALAWTERPVIDRPATE